MSEKSNSNLFSMYLEPWRVMPAPTAGYFIYSDQLGYVVGACDEKGEFGCIQDKYAAHVIAAAPEMLEALMLLTAGFFDIYNPKSLVVEEDDGYDAVFEVLEKLIPIFENGEPT